MNRDRRLRRRVRAYLRELGDHAQCVEPIGPMPRHGLVAVRPPERERLVYEGPLSIEFVTPAQGVVTLADEYEGDDLAAAIVLMLGAEREGGWLPDVEVRARVVVEILE